MYSPSSVSKDYAPNTVVTLTANSAFGHNFSEWGGDISSLDSVVQITMDSDKSVIVTFTPVVSVESAFDIPTEYSLKQNYPNPFNPSTMVEYSIPAESKVILDIFNVQGELVEILVDNYQSEGVYKINWNPTNLTSGLYILRMRAGNFFSSRKLVLMK